MQGKEVEKSGPGGNGRKLDQEERAKILKIRKSSSWFFCRDEKKQFKIVVASGFLCS